MRLTDKPKSLSEMRPDVSWPAEVQGVMDRALERDASLRYQAATDFGRDLIRAVDRMGSHAPASLDPTASKGSAPATRFGPPGPTPRSSPTVTVGSGGGSQAPETAVAPAGVIPAPPGRKILVPVVSSIAVLLLVSAVIYRPIMNLITKPPAVAVATNHPAADTTHPANDTSHQAQIDPPVQPKPDTMPPKDSVRRPQEQFANGKPLSSNPPTGTVNVAKELAGAEASAKREDPESARTALRRIASIQNHLASDVDFAHAGLIEFEAYTTLNDATKACAALARVKDRARGTAYQSKVDQRLEGC